jgi:phosphopantothenoylcysteine synthetase/decarboxylase
MNPSPDSAAAVHPKLRLLITAGPTREPVDPVRYLTNRSSGRMGYALATAAADAGHEVVLVSGPVSIEADSRVNLIRVETAREMFEATRERIGRVDVALFSAAVADYRPVRAATQKIKKGEGGMTLELERTEDILGSARSVFGFKGYLVGFAAETENLLDNARSKLERKGCDLILANDVSVPGIGFDSPLNEVILCLPDGHSEVMPRCSKVALARKIIEFIADRIAEKQNPPISTPTT